jgi:predicted HTH transcriptional regulator
MQALIQKAGDQLIRRRFASIPELTAGVYASLVELLGHWGAISTGPFDASACRGAALSDISKDKISAFLARAQQSRGYALGPGTPMQDALVHLNLLDHDNPSNAAILLFGTQPQRFLISSEVKCLHFHGTEVRKPIPSYQVYKGDLFELVDATIDFVMSKLNRSVGTRALTTAAPETYEIPRDAVAEAIVNAIAHRDYSSTASVQVMLFSDRLEVWNPGELPPSLTIESLRRPHASVPHNPLIAEPLFLTRLVERAGTGILDMLALCKDAGLKSPEFRQDAGSFVQTLWRPPIAGSISEQAAATDHATAHVGTKLALSRHQVDILSKCLKDSDLKILMTIADRTDRTKFRHQVLNPLIDAGLVEMTIPDKPTSSNQRYRTTEKGRTWLAGRKRQT